MGTNDQRGRFTLCVERGDTINGVLDRKVLLEDAAHDDLTAHIAKCTVCLERLRTAVAASKAGTQADRR